jgi:hypothetical protein
LLVVCCTNFIFSHIGLLAKPMFTCFTPKCSWVVLYYVVVI